MNRILAIFSAVILTGAIFLAVQRIPPLRDCLDRISPARHVVLISVDTLRPDRLGCCGSSAGISPVIDFLARRGCTFQSVIAQRGLTWPSLASIHTSLYPVSHGVRTNGQVFPTPCAALAPVLKNHGFITAAFLANCTRQDWQGFDVIGEEAFGNDYIVTNQAIRWLTRTGDSDWIDSNRIFLWVHYLAPHQPYSPPRPFDRMLDPDYTGPVDGSTECLSRITVDQVNPAPGDLEHIIALYDGEIAFIDREIWKLLQALEDTGVLPQALVIFTSDHGEDLHQHNRYFFHAASVYGSTLDIPLIIAQPPDRMIPGVIPVLAESIDIAPTALDLAGIPVPAVFQGTSFLPIINRQYMDPGPAFSEWESKILSVRTDTHRYIYNPLKFHPPTLPGASRDLYPIGMEELYRLDFDPAEQENLIGSIPNETDDLRSEIAAWKKIYGWMSTADENTRINLDDETKRQLRTLGYVMY
ncbi:sulfatase-like hydrolase/transferase [bacterium]|nr:sulfatase-like hydrolase/transferase [candidate division CSSED10-310 bacterium]